MSTTVEKIFSDRDFSELMYPVHTVGESTNIMGKFKDLQKLNSFLNYDQIILPTADEKQADEILSEKYDKNKVIRYIVYCYDRSSPILKRFSQDEGKRKSIAALYAGWEANEEGFMSPEVENIFRCKVKHINTMIIDYIQQYHDPEFALMVVGYEAYYQKLNLLLAQDLESNRDVFLQEETKGKLFVSAQKMAADLDGLAQKILTDENKLLKTDLYCLIDEATKNKLKITPERLAGVA